MITSKFKNMLKRVCPVHCYRTGGQAAFFHELLFSSTLPGFTCNYAGQAGSEYLAPTAQIKGKSFKEMAKPVIRFRRMTGVPDWLIFATTYLM
jgi:hypothetical protein